MMRLTPSTLAFAAILALTVPFVALAHDVSRPRVPAALRVPEGHRAYHIARAAGTQNYLCLPTATGFGWTLFGPQATLFNDEGKQVLTHFLSPNPLEAGTPRATWQDSRDSSATWAMAIATSTDAAYVAPGAIPWLLLEVVGGQDGPTGGNRISDTTYIQRVNTSAGPAPATGCAQATDVGKRSLVPYAATYVFFRSLDEQD